MTKMFGNMKNLKTEGLEKQGDVLGGGFKALDSDAYPAKIKLAYAGESAGGAQNITFHFDIDGKETRQTIYFTNKKGENFYVKDGVEKELPGFTTVNDICLIASGEGLVEQETEKRVVKLYNFDNRKEEDTEVDALVGLHDQEIILGLQKKIQDVQKKEGDEYVNTGKTREINEIDKVFQPETYMTVTEVVTEQEEAVFYPKWLEKNQGETIDESTGGEGNTGAPGASKKPAGGGAAKPKTSLFKK